MPEGHTIHRIAKVHQRDFLQQRLEVCSPQGRFAAGAKRLNGRVLEGVDAHGKHLFYRWEGGQLLHIHLGLYGKFRSHLAPVPPPQGQVRLRVQGAKKAFDLNGPNTCALITRRDWGTIRARLGEDPLRDDGDPERAWQRISRSRTAIGTLLLNQSIIAGVGNIYRSEVMYVLGIHPDTRGHLLTKSEFDALWVQLVTLLKIGVRYNRIIVADPQDIGKPRSRMNRDERLLIYKRETCLRCDGRIQSWPLGGRTVFACPRCQPARHK